MTTTNKDFDTSHLTDEQRKIAEVILKTTFGDSFEERYYDGQMFYSPSEWRGDYGTNSELVISYGRGDAYYSLSYDGCYEMKCISEGAVDAYATAECVTEELAKIGYFIEQCTTSYAAVYKI